MYSLQPIKFIEYKRALKGSKCYKLIHIHKILCNMLYCHKRVILQLSTIYLLVSEETNNYTIRLSILGFVKSIHNESCQKEKNTKLPGPVPNKLIVP